MVNTSETPIGVVYEKIDRKTRCCVCGSLDVIFWGTRNSKQRFKCKECGVLFTSGNKNVSQRNSRIRFEKWVCERQSFDYLSKESGYNERTLRRMFNVYLNSYPQWKIPVDKSIHILIDGTYFTPQIYSEILSKIKNLPTIFVHITIFFCIRKIVERKEE